MKKRVKKTKGWLQLHVGQTCSLLAAAHRRTHTQILRLCSLLQACRAHGELLQDIVVKMIADNYRTLRDSSAVLHRLARRRERCGEASNQQEMCRHPLTRMGGLEGVYMSGFLLGANTML